MYGIKKVWATKVTEARDKDVEGLGVLRFEGDKIYKYVRYVDGNAGSAGECVAYNDTNATQVVRSAAARGFAGVLLCSVTQDQYCWIQIYGPANVRAGANISAGNVVAHTATGAVTALDDTYAAADLKQLVGVVLEDISNGSTGKVYIKRF